MFLIDLLAGLKFLYRSGQVVSAQAKDLCAWI